MADLLQERALVHVVCTLKKSNGCRLLQRWPQRSTDSAPSLSARNPHVNANSVKCTAWSPCAGRGTVKAQPHNGACSLCKSECTVCCTQLAVYVITASTQCFLRNWLFAGASIPGHSRGGSEPLHQKHVPAAALCSRGRIAAQSSGLSTRSLL